MKSKYIAESGLLVALTLVILYATYIFPFSKLSMLTIASCLIPISIIRTSIKNALLVYISSSILSFLLVSPNIAISYTLFFGVYGIIKYFIEKIRKLRIELIIKLILFNLLLSLTYLITKTFLGIISMNFSLWFLWILSQGAFLSYDYVLTIAVSFFLNRFHKHI